MVSLAAIRRLLQGGSGTFTPSAEIALIQADNGLTLKTEEGDGHLVVKRVALLPDDTWTKYQYWSGAFRLVLANPPKGGGAQPDTVLDVAIGGRQEPVDILRGLASHINRRSSYGAQVKDGVLEILGPTSVKTPRARAVGLENVFADGYVRAA